MITSIILMCISGCLLVWYIISKCEKYDLKELFLKIAISFLFVVVAIVSSFSSGKFTMFNLLVITGLLLGLLGDVFLDLKYVDKERELGYTYAGFIVFGIGHILFITALCLNYYQSGGILFIILPIITSILLAALTILLEKPLKLKYGKMKLISFCYAICLFGSVSFSLFLSIQNGFQITSLTMFFIGSVLFTLSDLVLSGTFFGEGKERPIDFILNYSTYYSAQFVIAFMLLFA